MIQDFLPWRRPRIPVVELHGLLSPREGALNLKSVGPAIKHAFRAAAGRSGRQGAGHVILDIDSPGGSPVQSDLIGELIRREAAEASVRVHAVIQEVGASGGYWLACAADEIRANPMSIVGSIGVIGGGFGVPNLINRYGIERRLYTSGVNKARLDPFSPERPQDVVFINALMNDVHERFKTWVRQRRGARLAAEDVVFDGSFFLGAKALELGLIDGFGDVDRLLRELRGPKAAARIFRPRRRRGLLSRLPRLLARGVAEAVLEIVEERQGRIDLRL
jgi:signal peptide peptidase SppA